MIQVYLPTNTKFEKNGDMVLFPTEATVTASLNAEWTLELEQPIDSEGRWKYLVDQAVLKVPSFNGEQLFRVVSRKKTDTSVSVVAQPIFLDSRNDCFLLDVRPTGKNGQETLDVMTSPNEKYQGRSDITTRNTSYYIGRNLIEAICGEDENSFLNRWGGEILYDNFTIVINERIGGDYGVQLLYGKNLVRDGIGEDVDFSGVVTRLYPQAFNGRTISDNGFVDSPLAGNYPIIMARTVSYQDVKLREDLQEGEDEEDLIICDSQEELDKVLQEKCNAEFAAGLDKPAVTLSASMVLLENTQEYAEFKDLEHVSLGDTVHLRHSRLGITSDARIITLEYDCIRERVSSVVIGDFARNYFNDLSSTVENVQTRVNGAIRSDGSIIAEQVQGFLDGTMATLRVQNSIAQKQEARAILFEDLDPDSPTFGALSLGTQGLEISRERTEDDRDWVWTTAITANGIIADTVITGLLSDKNSSNYWNLDAGEFHLSAAGVSIDDQSAGEYFGGIADASVQALDEKLTQEEVFNRLTNDGDLQGIYMQDGKLYINGEYIKTGTITAGLGKSTWDLSSGNFRNVNGNEWLEISDSVFKGGFVGTQDGILDLSAQTSNDEGTIDRDVSLTAFSNSIRFSAKNLVRFSIGSLEVFEIASSGPRIFNLPVSSSSAHQLVLNDEGDVCYTLSSSMRYKDVGEEVTIDDVKGLYDAKVVWAKYRDGQLPESDERCGVYYPMFLAEDMEEHFPLVVDHRNGQPENWNERVMIPILLKLIQDQDRRITALEKILKGDTHETAD